tara:strand:+ start:3488 stop:3748 length:261 start_codon:yes stop_codon:yes gene_type:complete
MEGEKRFARQLIGKTVVSKSGKRFGEVGGLYFELRTGELIQLLLRSPTAFAEGLELERDKNGSFLVPFSSVVALGDYLVISEEEII